MYLIDYHVHSDVSEDCKSSMRAMAEAEAAAGVRVMCFTNHCDLFRWEDDLPKPRCRDIARESAEKLALLRAETGTPPLEIRLGLELGEGHRDPELAALLASDERLDFVLGSLHLLPGYGDFYWQHYTTHAQCEQMFDLYLDELQQIAELDYYDVIAHFGYGRRYMLRDGVDAAMTLERFGGKIERVLRTVIDKGRGIELNCSGLTDASGPFPSEEILLLYRSLGGETVTLGSDAHSPAQAAHGLAEGLALLRRCGFDRVALFRERKAEYLKIETMLEG